MADLFERSILGVRYADVNMKSSANWVPIIPTLRAILDEFRADVKRRDQFGTRSSEDMRGLATSGNLLFPARINEPS